MEGRQRRRLPADRPPPVPAAAAAAAAAAARFSAPEPSAGLAATLSTSWARQDRRALWVAVSTQLTMYCLTHRRLTAGENCYLLTLILLELGTLVFNLAQPRHYVKRYRVVLVVLIRGLAMALPTMIDALRVMQPAAAAAAAAVAAADAADAAAPGTGATSACGSLACPAAAIACGGGSRAAALVGRLRAIGVLVLPVSWLHACFLLAVAMQLPPLVYIATQMAGVGLLMHRAPQACQQFVAGHPCHAQVAEAGYWLLRQTTSLVCLGTREHLAAAAAAASGAQKCTAVVWSLEASLGFVLPTLMVWHGQVRHVQEYLRQRQRLQLQVVAAAAAAQRQRRWDVAGSSGGSSDSSGDGSRGRGTSTGSGPGTVVLEEEGFWSCLLAGHYRLLCEPVLEAAGMFGWPVAVSGSALAGFLAAVVRQSVVGKQW